MNFSSRRSISSLKISFFRCNPFSKDKSFLTRVCLYPQGQMHFLLDFSQITIRILFSIFQAAAAPHFLRNIGSVGGGRQKDPHAGGGNDSIVIISIGLSSVGQQQTDEHQMHFAKIESFLLLNTILKVQFWSKYSIFSSKNIQKKINS